MSKACILVVDDRPDIRLSAGFVLEDNGYQVLEAESPYQAKEIIQNSKVDLILLDMNYSLDTTSGDEGLELLSWLAKSAANIPAVAMTAWSNVELAVKAMQLGAGDFIEKPWKNQRLLQVIEHQLTLTGLKVQNQKLQQRLEPEQSDDYVWRSPCMQELMRQVESVAQTDVTILLTGDNGTGKSQLAKYIHQRSAAQSGPFISVNMGAISESLFESEMFGHSKGAFTDAKATRIGRFELADGGSLFLDEIANTPYSQQGKLLRVLEDREFEKVGGNKTQQVDIRLICATNADLNQAVEQQVFRKDLLYRINTITIEIPPLRNRIDDITPLAQSFLDQTAAKYGQQPLTLSREARAALMAYGWPGNIRELHHVMERAQILSTGQEITVAALGLPSTSQTSEAPAYSLPGGTLPTLDKDENGELPSLASLELEILEQRMSHFSGNAVKAAKSLGLSRSAFYRRLGKSD